MRATIEFSERLLISLVNQELDTAQKNEIFGIFWKIAEDKGFCDSRGNPIGKAKAE